MRERHQQINPDHPFREKSLMVISYVILTNGRIWNKCGGRFQTRQNKVGLAALARTLRNSYTYLLFSVGLKNRHVRANTRERLPINSSAGICPLEKKTTVVRKVFDIILAAEFITWETDLRNVEVVSTEILFGHHTAQVCSSFASCHLVSVYSRNQGNWIWKKSISTDLNLIWPE